MACIRGLPKSLAFCMGTKVSQMFGRYKFKMFGFGYFPYSIVDEDCYPYESGSTGAKGSCMISRKIKSLLEINQCRSSNLLSGRTELYRSQPAYRISSRENDIKYEIMTYGPVQGKEHSHAKNPQTCFIVVY